MRTCIDLTLRFFLSLFRWERKIESKIGGGGGGGVSSTRNSLIFKNSTTKIT